MQKLFILQCDLQALYEQVSKKEKRLELELSSIETSLTEADEKLYSGVITTEKEVKSLQGEILHLKERQDVLESDLLETLSLLEEINSNIDKCNSELEIQNDEIQTVESPLMRSVSIADIVK